jgi:hypothetical protein
MRFACWVTKAKNTLSEYIILIAFTRQQWLSERACYVVLHYCLFGYTCLNIFKAQKIALEYRKGIQMTTLPRSLDVSLTSTAERERTHSVKQNSHNYSTSWPTMQIK